jgi:hypothetical protein
MSNSNTGVCISGTMQNVLNQGITEHDAICEGIDNSLDAKSNKIYLSLEPKTENLVLVRKHMVSFLVN